MLIRFFTMLEDHLIGYDAISMFSRVTNHSICGQALLHSQVVVSRRAALSRIIEGIIGIVA